MPPPGMTVYSILQIGKKQAMLCGRSKDVLLSLMRMQYTSASRVSMVRFALSVLSSMSSSTILNTVRRNARWAHVMGSLG